MKELGYNEWNKVDSLYIPLDAFTAQAETLSDEPVPSVKIGVIVERIGFSIKWLLHVARNLGLEKLDVHAESTGFVLVHLGDKLSEERA